MSLSGKIFKNIFSNWAGFSINIIVAFFLSPFIVHKLGNVYYGLWVVVLQLTGYLGILELGVRSSVVKYISQHYAGNEEAGINETVGAAISLYTISGALCLFIAGIVAIFVPVIFNVQEMEVSTARWLVIITGITAAQGFAFNVFYGVLMGIQRYDVYNKIFIGMALLRALLILVVLRQGYGIIALSLIQLSMNIFTNLLVYIYCKKFLPYLKVRLFDQQRATYRLILSYSIISFIITIAQKLIYQTDAFVIGCFMSVSFVTFYAIPFTLVEYMRRFVIAMTEIFVPVSSELSARNENDMVKQVLIQGTRASILIGAPFCIVFMVMGHTFIKLWMGLEYAMKGEKVLIILAIASLISLIHLPAREIFYGLAKHRLNSWCYSIEALANIVISIILVSRWGIEGVAIGTAIPDVVLSLLVFPFLISKILHLSVYQFMIKAVFPAFVSLAPFSLGCILVEKYFSAQSLYILFIQILFLLPVLLSTAWYVTFDSNERLHYKSLILKIICPKKASEIVTGQ